MRITRRHILAVAVLLAAGCSRESTPAPTPVATTAPADTAAPATAAQTAPPAAAVFGQEELDQMVAPIALYPDPLLAQVMMAATYPGDVAEAAAWSKAHPEAKGDAAVKQVAEQPWDPSVQSLVAFPQALAVMGQDPGWVQRLGDAFLAQPDAVMDAVQRLRRAAQQAGNLQTTPQQTVTVQPAAASAAAPVADGSAPVSGSDTIIQIQPADPQVVYVPSYNPSVVYGAWPYPSYPPAYYPPPPAYYAGSALVAGLAFGTGVAVADALWGDCDWGHNDIDINVNRYNNINVNRQINTSQNTWQHNAINRDSVPYRDARSRAQFGQQHLPGADARQAFRGSDPAHAASRDRARQEMQRRGFASPATDNRQAQASARSADRELRDRPQAGQRAQGGQGTQAARDRARGVADARTQSRPGAGQRAQQAGARTSHANTQARQQARSQHAQPPRQQARAQQPRTQSHPQARSPSRNNAFAGASHPQQSRAQASRGHASHAQAQRPASARAAGHPVQRAPRGGGAHRRG